MGRGGGLRPASSLGLRPPDGRAADNGDDDGGEWTTIVSKFHFVDLAGSERVLKFLLGSAHELTQVLAKTNCCRW
jgi:hypothetical protein